MKIQKGGATMKRDMYKTVAATEIPYRYDMNLAECRTLADKAREGKLYEAISTAFTYGFALGQRSAKKSPGTKTGAR